MSIKSACGRGGFVRLVTIAGLTALLAACSSSADRFGPFDGQKSAKADPGYTPASSPITTSAITPRQAANPYDRSVSRASLKTPAPGQVTVRHGDTLYSIARSHQVKVSELIAANNLQPPYQVNAGQTLRMPRSAVASSRRPVNLARQNTPARYKAQARPKSHTVRHGETLYRISTNYGFKPARIAAHNGLSQPYTIKAGQVLRIPGSTTTASNKYVPLKKRKSALKITPMRTASVKPASVTKKHARSNTGLRKRAPYTGPLPTPAAMVSDKFRWPVRGRVISQYGGKTNGQRNDGINIAVPEGTSIKAAENGVVAYAGNELRGYGNLVLVRHASGWVTAYAHGSKLLVQRGDRVKRGQIIAKAGRTGSVTRPQLHFEIRKGSKAVNPVDYMSTTHVATR